MLLPGRKALIPILLQCTDDVNPNVRLGDDIDIRHYVKLKKIPGGKCLEIQLMYLVLFLTKNLALKEACRSEYLESQNCYCFIPYRVSKAPASFYESLGACHRSGKGEFLRNMVNRIASLRPQLLLVQKHISGLALQYLKKRRQTLPWHTM